jgi:hypothetical protein
LGLEGNMLTTLTLAIPSGLHISLSVMLGYAVRYAEGLPVESKPFALFGFIFGALLAIIAMAMLLFFVLSIPTMLYSMGLIAIMLRWVGKRWPREKLASTIIGGVMGLLIGIGSTALILMLTDMPVSWALYGTLFRWPAILTIDGIILLWFTLNPLVNAIAGAQIGWRLGKQFEELSLYWFW